MGRQISAVASLTCDRVDIFSESVTSIVDELRKHDQKRPVVVFDDSASPDVREQKRNILSELQQSSGTDIRYIGLEEKSDFLNSIQAALPEEYHQAVRFLIYGDPEFPELKGAGGNRNAMLAAFAGKSFISFDDDTLVKPCTFKDSSTDVTYEQENPDLIIGGFPDKQTIENETGPFTDDIFRMFDSVLGSVSENLVPGIKHGRVKAVMAGIYGGRWYSRPFGILQQRGVSRDLAYRSPREYKKAKYTPCAFLQAPNIILTDSSFLVSTAIGIDVSENPPPFFPQLRTEDNIWAVLSGCCSEDFRIAHLPFAVYHEEKDKKPFADRDFKNTGTDMSINMIQILSAFSEEYKLRNSNESCAYFGNALIGLSQLSHNNWFEMCRGLWFRYVGDMVNSLQRILEEYDRKPGFWAKDIEKYMDRLRSKSMEAESFIPRELHAAGSLEEAGIRHRKILYNYGTLLVRWERIWQEILRMNAEGEGLLKKDYNTLF